MLVNAPANYFDLFTDLPHDIVINDEVRDKKDFIHLFTTKEKELRELLPQLKKRIVADGLIWVSWPKKSAKVASDVSENTIRDIAIANGLVDVKVCAVDDTWSGLKLIIPVKDR